MLITGNIIGANFGGDLPTVTWTPLNPENKTRRIVMTCDINGEIISQRTQVRTGFNAETGHELWEDEANGKNNHTQATNA